jgi:hypothetical protein
MKPFTMTTIAGKYHVMTIIMFLSILDPITTIFYIDHSFSDKMNCSFLFLVNTAILTGRTNLQTIDQMVG